MIAAYVMAGIGITALVLLALIDYAEYKETGFTHELMLDLVGIVVLLIMIAIFLKIIW